MAESGLASTSLALTAAQARQLDTALRLLQNGAIAEALAIARRVVEDAPRNPEAQQLVALCHVKTGAVDEAEKVFRRALELSPAHPHVLANLATLLRKLGRRDEAVTAWRKAVAASPDFAQAWIDLGVTELGAGRISQALEALAQATVLRPGSALAWHALGNAHRSADALESAEAAFRRAVALDPAYRSGWVNLGAVLRLLGRPDESLVCYGRARRAGYEGPDLDNAVVGALLDSGEVDQALVEARRVARSHPGFVQGQVTLSHLLWEYGPAQAPGEDPFGSFRAVAADQPDNPALQLAFVHILLEARNADDALERILALRAQSDSAQLIRLHADALEMLGRPDESGVLYGKLHSVLGINSDPAFLNAYTRHLLRNGQWELAARCAMEAVEADPRNQEAWAYLGTAWRLLGDPREFWLCDYERLVTTVDVEPPGGFASVQDFLLALTTTLEPMHKAAREPMHQSLRGGSQTSGCLFGRPDPVLVATQRAMSSAVERWLVQLPADPGHPFLRYNTGKVRFSGSWSVKLWSSGKHANHIHSQGWMSSAFYVALPAAITLPKSEGDLAGHIQFGQPPAELGLGLAPRRTLRPEQGRLALFPSYLWHGTVPFADEAPRLTIAFDMRPRE